MISALLLQVEWVTKLIDAAAEQGFSALILAVMIGLLCIALGVVWKQYINTLQTLLNAQQHNKEIVNLLNNRNYDALKELVVRMEAERRFNN